MTLVSVRRSNPRCQQRFAARLAATLDFSDPPQGGDALPLLWHWAYFTPSTGSAELGEDGHPRLTCGLLSAYPRRMWASGDVEFKNPLVLGIPATRTSRIQSAKESMSRSGRLVFVTVEHRYSQDDSERVVERQTLVYRQAGPPMSLPVGEHVPVLMQNQWLNRQTLDSRLLFRFSAITFNTHRIHYDRSYASLVEGYPTLVVHGPLTALLVAECIRKQSGSELTRFRFRASAPLFVDSTFLIIGSTDTPVTAQVVRNDGVEAMRVSAELKG